MYLKLKLFLLEYTFHSFCCQLSHNLELFSFPHKSFENCFEQDAVVNVCVCVCVCVRVKNYICIVHVPHKKDSTQYFSFTCQSIYCAANVGSEPGSVFYVHCWRCLFFGEHELCPTSVNGTIVLRPKYRNLIKLRSCVD